MAAANTDKFQLVGSPGTATTLSAPGYTIAASSINVGSTTNWPTTTGVIFGIDTATIVDGEEVRVPGSYCVFAGTVNSATSINNLTLLYGTPQNYAAGALTRVYITVSALHNDRLVGGLLVSLAQDGTVIPSVPLTTPKVTTSINDANGNEVIKTPATASAINEITVTNAAIGNAPSITATGGDTNIDLVLGPKGTGTIKTSPVNRMDWTALALGSVVQVVSTNFSEIVTGTTVIPNDDTIPQITEGVEFMTQAITPKSTANILVIEANIFLAISSNGQRIAALFQDATANALAAESTYVGNFTDPVVLTVRYTMTAGTTSATTFRIRGGSESAGTWTFNGTGGARKFGAITKSNFKITEYKA